MDGWVTEITTALMSLDGLTIYGIGFSVLLLCGLGLPVPEDITLLLMGYMVASLWHTQPSAQLLAWWGSNALFAILRLASWRRAPTCPACRAATGRSKTSSPR